MHIYNKMNVQEFSTLYYETVNAYIYKHETDMNKYTIDGKIFDVYTGFEQPFCMTLSQKYILPPEISEIIKIPKILKKHAEVIHVGIRYELDWCDDGIESVWGVDHYYFWNFVCDGCGWYGFVDIMWAIPRYTTNRACIVCSTCYHSERFNCKYGCKNTHIKSDYMHYGLNDFNVTDWVRFMWDTESTFHVNCNPESFMYGSICMLSDGYNGKIFSKIGNCKQLLNYITEWVQIPAPMYPLNDVLQYLESTYYVMSEVRLILTQAGIAVKDITVREIFQNMHKIKSPKDLKYIEDELHEELLNEMLGSPSDLYRFSLWLKVKLNISDPE